jgi:hypothetical protein
MSVPQERIPTRRIAGEAQGLFEAVYQAQDFFQREPLWKSGQESVASLRPSA